MVRQFLVILVAACVAALPLRGLVAAGCEGCGGSAGGGEFAWLETGSAAAAGESAAPDPCCNGSPSRPSTDPSETSPEHDEPGEGHPGGCDCPLSCCASVAKAPLAAGVIPDRLSLRPVAGSISPTALRPETDPHLLTLKRPPRIETSV